MITLTDFLETVKSVYKGQENAPEEPKRPNFELLEYFAHHKPEFLVGSKQPEEFYNELGREIEQND
ncbi:hypothetical protein GF358_02235 [Candidatus Woesearchaeota archaeon]|nr:hypothetical protein [Candidatus Woesearchaeota archaeon]